MSHHSNSNQPATHVLLSSQSSFHPQNPGKLRTQLLYSAHHLTAPPNEIPVPLSMLLHDAPVTLHSVTVQCTPSHCTPKRDSCPSIHAAA
ncbi:UNVERIFIED_CONTAM: hypothetical protein FKN15_059238 [Acipenser sinensis]